MPIVNRVSKLAIALFLVGCTFFVIHSSNRLGAPTTLIGTQKSESVGTVHRFFLLDRTGSMSSLKSAVEDGYAKYVAQQQSHPGSMMMTVAQFDSVNPFEVLIEGQEIHSVARRLEHYQPRGTTPLYDAIERMIVHAEACGSDEVIIVIFTDGGENASLQATRQGVFDKIEEKKKRGWSFVFLGANQDSFQSGREINVARGSTMNYAATHQGVDYGWGTVSMAMARQRTIRARSGFTKEDRLAQAANFFDTAGARSADTA